MELAGQVWEIFMSERLCLFRSVAAVVGLLYLLRTAYRVLSFLCPFVKAYLLAPLGIFRPDLKKYGSWAVVTGASEGIGRAYAIELAKRGLNVVLLSRSQAKLDKVADEIKSKYSVEVRVVPVDFLSGQEVYPLIAQQLQDMDIGILVNNVGLSYEFANYFLEVPCERFRNIIELNCQVLVQMTHVLLPKMVERKRGLVINISSLSGEFPFPLLTVYSASKAFVLFFSAALTTEYAGKGIEIQTITPGLVATAMSGVKKPRFDAPSASYFASSALNTVGHYHHTAGCIAHLVQSLLIHTIPWVKSMALNSMVKARIRGLKRKQREKKE
jgi:17beta-estradiol 17-dehydrogenase / very-long-chain 3-oxoacyl-CoA reductase